MFFSLGEGVSTNTYVSIAHEWILPICFLLVILSEYATLLLIMINNFLILYFFQSRGGSRIYKSKWKVAAMLTFEGGGRCGSEGPKN